jgi:hypothetical protein
MTNKGTLYFLNIALVMQVLSVTAYCQINAFIDGDPEYLGAGIGFVAKNIEMHGGTQLDIEYQSSYNELFMRFVPYAGIGLRAKITNNWDIKEMIDLMAQFSTFAQEQNIESYYAGPIFRAVIETIYTNSEMPLGLSINILILGNMTIELKPRITVYFKFKQSNKN